MIPERLPDASTPSGPPPSGPNKPESQLHRVEKVVTRSLDTAARSALNLSKWAWTQNADLPLFYIVFHIPTGIVTGIIGCLLLGLEKLGELVSGGRPITLNDSFEEAVESSDKNLVTNETKGWIGHDSAQFLKDLKSRFQSIRKEYLPKKEELEHQQKKLPQEIKRLEAATDKIVRSDRNKRYTAQAAFQKDQNVEQYRTKLQELENEKKELITPLQNEMYKLQVQLTDVEMRQKNLESTYMNRLVPLQKEYQEFTSEKRLKKEHLEYVEKTKEPLSFEAFKAKKEVEKLDAAWQAFIKAKVPGNENLSRVEYIADKDRYDRLSNHYNNYKWVLMSTQSVPPTFEEYLKQVEKR